MKNKLDTLDFLMSNDKTSKIIKEAFGAPIGSSKREMAKAILSIMNRASGDDGKGSASVSVSSGKIERSDPKDYGFESYIVFPYVPDPEDGQGAVTDYWSNLGNTNIVKGAINSFQNPPWASSQEEIAAKEKESEEFRNRKTINPFVEAISGVNSVLPTDIRNFNLAVAGYDPTTGKKLGDNSNKNTSISSGSNISSPWLGYSSRFGFPSSTDTIPSFGKNLQATDQNSKSDSSGKEYGYSTVNTPTVSADTIGTNTSNLETTNYNTTEDGIMTDYSLKKIENPTTNEEKLYNLAIDAISRNTGSSMFATGIMGNKDYSSMLPGYEDYFGKNLADIKKENSDLLKKEYGLDDLKRSVLDTAKRNSVLKTDATNYIKGKDEYLRTINDKLTAADDKFLSGDVSDPAIQKSYNNYKTYLTILKGRQEQNYQDYLQQTIDTASAELTTLSDTYKSAVDSFNTAIQYENASDEETFNNIKNSLTGMYEALSTAEEVNMTKSMNYLNLAKSNMDMIKYLETNSGSSNYTIEDEIKLVKLAQDLLTSSIKTDSGNVLVPKANINLYNEISNRDAVSAKIFINEYGSALRNYIDNNVNGLSALPDYETQIKSLAQYYPNLAGSLYSIISASKITGGDKKVIDSKFNDIVDRISKLVNKASTGFLGFGGQYTADTLRNDLKSLGLSEESSRRLSLLIANAQGQSGIIESIKAAGPQALITTLTNYAE